MESRWSLEWRERNDAEMRKRWDQMAERVMREARVFSGLEPGPATELEHADDIDSIDESELDDIGNLGDTDGQ